MRSALDLHPRRAEAQARPRRGRRPPRRRPAPPRTVSDPGGRFPGRRSSRRRRFHARSIPQAAPFRPRPLRPAVRRLRPGPGPDRGRVGEGLPGEVPGQRRPGVPGPRHLASRKSAPTMVKEHLWVLWTDYFKPEHVEKYPDLHDKFWKATKLAGDAKKSRRPGAGAAAPRRDRRAREDLLGDEVLEARIAPPASRKVPAGGAVGSPPPRTMRYPRRSPASLPVRSDGRRRTTGGVEWVWRHPTPPGLDVLHRHRAGSVAQGPNGGICGPNGG